MARFDVRIEIRPGNRWVDITPDVYTREDIEIERGRPDETSDVDHGKCSLTINNRGGKYSSRNPMGPYYGQLGRNTPLRVTVGIPTVGDADETEDSGVTTHTAPSVNSRAGSGLLICAWITSFEPGDYTGPGSMTRDAETSAEGSTVLSAHEELTDSGDTGDRDADFTPDDDEANGYASAAVAVPGDNGAPVIEEFWDDHRYAEPVEFATSSDTLAGWWLVAVQGWQYDYNDAMPNVPGGTSGRWLLIADSQTANSSVPRVRVWTRQVLVDGPQLVTFPTAGDGLRNNHARLYLLSGVPFSSARFAGEVAAWPQRWDASDTDVHVPIEAAGILRRLGQGAKKLASTVQRQTLAENMPEPVAYWPCEDGENATSIASALPGGEPMTITGVADLAAFDEFDSSRSLPQMATSTFSGTVPDYDTSDDEAQVQWLLAVPADGADNEVPIIDVHTTGSAARWQVRYHGGGGGLSFHVFNGSGVEIHDSGVIAFDVDGLLLRCALELTQNGSDIDYRYGQIQPGADTSLTAGRTVAGETFGRIQRVVVAANRADASIGDTALGHVTVHNTITSVFDLGNAWGAWREESAGRRIERLCGEEGIAFTAGGDLDGTEPMGPQAVETLLDLLREAAEADGGILHETRTEIGLTYRPRQSLYNQQEQ